MTPSGMCILSQWHVRTVLFPLALTGCPQVQAGDTGVSCIVSSFSFCTEVLTPVTVEDS